ncbi:MAG: hypothetical protein J6B30_00860 [Muribaculaceae bacterium]|nr:hypothetical protein [Muribaculaceae bacterium]MBR3829743.1 hypothetical protein [Muribaculaceae bacterium]
MKKSITIFTLILISLISFNSYAQSSKLIGTWVGEKINLPPNENGIQYSGYVTPVIALNNNENGAYCFYFYMTIPLDNRSTIEVKLAGNVPGEWSYSNETIYITLNKDKFQMNISEKCLVLKSNDRAIKQTFEENKAELIDMLYTLKNSFIEALPTYNVWSNVSLSKNKLTLTEEDGRVITYTRGKSKATDKSNSKSKKNSKTKAKSKTQKKRNK